MEIGDESQDSITDDATDLESTPTVIVNDNANDNVHDKADANEQDSRKYQVVTTCMEKTMTMALF